jgi:hypothetical protein
MTTKTLADMQQEAREAAEAKKMQEEAKAAAAAKVEQRTFYARLDGCTYVTKSGHICRFDNGEYVTDKSNEIEELEDLCKQPGQHLISLERVEVMRSDAKILKEVGAGRVASGPVSSAHLSGMMGGR